MPPKIQIVFHPLMLGPFEIIGHFATITRNTTLALTRQSSFREIGFYSIALLSTALPGGKILGNIAIRLPVLPILK